MDRGAWWATVHGVTKSQIRLSDCVLFIFTLLYCIYCTQEPQSWIISLWESSAGLRCSLEPRSLSLDRDKLRTAGACHSLRTRLLATRRVSMRVAYVAALRGDQ